MPLRYSGNPVLTEEMSQAEFAMFAELGFSHLFHTNIAIMAFYEIVVRDAFINNKTGPAVESLRRCAAAIEHCSPYRRTPEFDALIQLD
jgi:hypothetical protein